MKKLNYLLVLILIALFVTSCGKDGAMGPQGATGSTGATGAVGAVGPAGPAGASGKDGSIIYSGTTVPASSTGVVGDFYINLTTGLLYGPKTSTGWGTGFSLKGATGTTGATGAAGSKIYSGSGTPPTTTGAIGDYYLDITNYMLYGPKTATSWGSPLSLQGPTGPQGPVGPQGPAGNANVKTDVFTVPAASWATSSTGYMLETGGGGYTEYFMQGYVRSNNTITQDVLDNGLVLVYFTPSPTYNPNQWEPLPYVFTTISSYNIDYVYITAVGQVTLGFFFVKVDPASTLPNILSYVQTEDYKFKIVTVTGETGIFMMAHHVDLKNYYEVSKITGLWRQDRLKQ
jgi:hypothetical protein